MDRCTPSSETAFSTLPIELNKAIAHEIEADKDIATFRLICRATYNAVDADKRSFWRARFREKYDLKTGVSNSELSRIYKTRSKCLRRGTIYNFFRANSKSENRVIQVLRDLIVESFQGSPTVDEHGLLVSKNHACLVNFIRSSKILFNNRRPTRLNENGPPEVQYMRAAVKLMCSHFLFCLDDAKHDVFAYEECQQAVYQPTNLAPIYEGPDWNKVNTPWVLHNFNFFRHHMMNKEVETLYESIKILEENQKPSPWRQPLRNGSHVLAKHWKGTYAYLDQAEIKKIRTMNPDEITSGFFVDKNVEEGKIQSLKLEFVQDTAHQLKWPQYFEDRLQSLRNTTKPTDIKTQARAKPKKAIQDAQIGNIQFTGEGVDLEDDFSAIGWLNPLPPQAGIPGWQRITFMKHFMDDFDQIEADNLWAYEGVVLPGGRMILGRWWYASEQVNFDKDYNGPFILWAVDPEPEFELAWQWRQQISQHTTVM